MESPKHSCLSIRIAVLAVAIISLLAAAPTAFGAARLRAMYFESFDRESGLSQLAINAIAQDDAGFLWVGTEDGLNRFDGYGFTHSTANVGSSAALSSRFIVDLVRAPDGDLYVVSDGDGVFHRVAASGELQPIAPYARMATLGLQHTRVARFDRHGRLWIGTRNGGVVRFNPGNAQLDVFRADEHGAANAPVNAILEDARGILWFGTTVGLFRLNADGEFVPQPLPGLARVEVNAIVEDPRSGALWIGTAGGLVRLERRGAASSLYRHEADNPRTLPADTVNVLLRDSVGRLWIGTAGGLALFDATSDGFSVYRRDDRDSASLPDNDVRSLFEDRSGLLWIGTKFGGLAKWDPRTWSFDHHAASQEEGFASRNIMAITEDRHGRTWVGTWAGITMVDSRRDTTRTLRLTDDRVMSLISGRDGALWAGTMEGGLNRIDADTDRVVAYTHDRNDPRSLAAPGVMSIFEDSRNRLWVGTYGGGLQRLNRGDATFERYPRDADRQQADATERVTAIAEDPTGVLWIGTDGGGLGVLDPDTGHMTILRHEPDNPTTLSASTVYSIHIDARKRVWLGMRGGGLERVTGDPRNPASIRFQHFNEAEGLPNNSVYGVLSDADGRLWLSTNNGLARFDPDKRQVRTFHRADGLQGDEFNFGAYYASASGVLYFGGGNGYNVIRPAQLQLSRSPPPLVLTSFVSARGLQIAGPGALVTKQLHLGYREDDVTFEFAALDFASPRTNRFQYWLQGRGSGWTDVGTRRTISLIDLPGGTYTLKVRAASADGPWSKPGISIDLHVDPPPWRSTWAYTGYATIIAMALLAAWVSMRRSLKRHEQERAALEEAVRERTRELASHAQALEQANRKLEELSCTDPLTGLGNRRSLQYSLPRLLSTLPRGQAVAFMIADLDRLKPINDDQGHEAGDRVLAGVGKILRDTINNGDILVRWGGDEFVLVHACSSFEEAAGFAERARTAVSRNRFALRGNAVARTSCSIGFAMYPFEPAAGPGLSWEDVLALADGALYRSKIRRNAWVGWRGKGTAADLRARVLADPAAAENEGLIEVRVSAATTSETVDLLLKQARASRG